MCAEKPAENALEFVRKEVASIVERYKLVIQAVESINIARLQAIKYAIGRSFNETIDATYQEATKHWGTNEINAALKELGVFQFREVPESAYNEIVQYGAESKQ